MSLAEKIVEGDVRSTARLLRDIEDEIPAAREELKKIHAHTGNAHIIGITGSPGTGKSTLVDKLVQALRKRGKTVGVIAVDPSSPFTGGAILGDRIRMQKHSTDEGVFIRSVATRGQLGGISRSTNDLVDVLDAMGKDVVIVETVGVGQGEVEIVRMSQTTIVVVVPGMGDDVQALKAGILEVGDVFVVNKADHEGADKTVRELQAMLLMSGQDPNGWQRVVLKTQAHQNEGIPQLLQKLEDHQSFLSKEGLMEKVLQKRLRKKLLDELQYLATNKILEKVERNTSFDHWVRSMRHKGEDPYSLAERLIKEFMK